MEKEYKTFKDLRFEDYMTDRDWKSDYLRETYKGAKQAVMLFDNNYGVSVLFGKAFYSNGIDSYELAVIQKYGTGEWDWNICYDTPITDDVLARISEEEVTKVMKQVQDLKNA